VDVLTEVFGERLRFPIEFVGRGDMSRGGLLLRSVRAREELIYVPVVGAVRHGPRPPKLSPIRGILTNAGAVYGASEPRGPATGAERAATHVPVSDRAAGSEERRRSGSRKCR
jgi:hypothetical protein